MLKMQCGSMSTKAKEGGCSENGLEKIEDGRDWKLDDGRKEEEVTEKHRLEEQAPVHGVAGRTVSGSHGKTCRT